jgi:hypothetical protein
MKFSHKNISDDAIRQALGRVDYRKLKSGKCIRSDTLGHAGWRVGNNCDGDWKTGFG